MTDLTAVAVLCIAVAGVFAQWLAWRFRLPAIVLLFAAGLAVGPGLQILNPEEAFGSAARPLIGLAVAIVVFEGGLALDIRELRAASEGVLRLTAVAAPVSFALAALAAHRLAGLAWGAALLYGAITVVTGPTVVLPLLRHTRLERRAASLLKWEAIVNDPMGALLAAIVLALLVARGATGGGLALELLGGLVAAVALGTGMALTIRWLVRRDQLPEVLKTPMLLAATLGVYVLGNLVMDEAGLAAATIFGVALANLGIPGIREIARFKESLVVLIVSALFIVLTASLDRGVFARLSSPVILLTVAMIVLVRPLSIGIATLGTTLSWQERLLTCWIAPRGIVAAAVAGAAGTKLNAAGVPGGDEVMPAVFALIAATMVLHGFSLGPLARRLGLTLGDRPGVAIVGATAWSVDFAKALSSTGTPVLMIDTYPGALDRARDERLPVLQAEVLSVHGEEALAEQRIDYLVAATSNDVYNSLVCARLAPELGRGRVFQLAPAGADVDPWAGVDREWRGQILGAPAIDFATLRRRHKEGWRFTVTEHLAAPDKPDRALPSKENGGGDDAGVTPVALAIVRRNGQIQFASTETAAADAGPGDHVISLNSCGLTPATSQAGISVRDAAAA